MNKRTIALLTGILFAIAIAITIWVFWEEKVYLWINLLFALFKGLTLRGVLGFVFILTIRQIPIRGRKIIQTYLFTIMPLRVRVRVRARVYLLKKYFANLFGGWRSEGFRIFGLHFRGILAIAASVTLVMLLSSSVGSLIVLAVGWDSIWKLAKFWFGWLFKIIQNVLFYIAVRFKLDAVYKQIEELPVVKNNRTKLYEWYRPRRLKHHRNMIKRRKRVGKRIRRIGRKIRQPAKTTPPPKDTEA